MTIKLPKKLKKEPIIDAVFELRFNSTVPSSSILPGILFNKLSGTKTIEKLPAAQLPEQVRAADPNLQFAPLTSITCGAFVFLISDRSMAVACKVPYPGWTAFKTSILDAMKHIDEAGIVASVQRYGLKYVDMIPPTSGADRISLVNLDLTLGKNKLSKETFQVRVEIVNNDIINVVQVISSAEIIFPNGNKKEGLIIDIDSITNVDSITMKNFIKNLPNILENLHDINGQLFFDCLTDSTIASLDPIYE